MGKKSSLSKRKGANRAGSRAPLSASSASASETADDDASEDAGASVLDAAVDTTVNPGDSVSSSSAGEATSQPGTSSYAIATAGSATGGHSSSSLARATYRDALQQSKGAAGPPVLGGKRPSNSGEMPKPPSKRGSGSEFLETSTRNVSAAASGLLATGSLTHSRKLRAGVGLTALSTTGAVGASPSSLPLGLSLRPLRTDRSEWPKRQSSGSIATATVTSNAATYAAVALMRPSSSRKAAGASTMPRSAHAASTVPLTDRAAAGLLASLANDGAADREPDLDTSSDDSEASCSLLAAWRSRRASSLAGSTSAAAPTVARGRQLPSSRGAAAPTVAGCRSSYRPPAAPRRPSREGSRATSPTEMLSRALGKAAFSAATAEAAAQTLGPADAATAAAAAGSGERGTRPAAAADSSDEADDDDVPEDPSVGLRRQERKLKKALREIAKLEERAESTLNKEERAKVAKHESLAEELASVQASLETLRQEALPPLLLREHVPRPSPTPSLAALSDASMPDVESQPPEKRADYVKWRRGEVERAAAQREASAAAMAAFTYVLENGRGVKQWQVLMLEHVLLPTSRGLPGGRLRTDFLSLYHTSRAVDAEGKTKLDALPQRELKSMAVLQTTLLSNQELRDAALDLVEERRELYLEDVQEEGGIGRVEPRLGETFMQLRTRVHEARDGLERRNAGRPPKAQEGKQRFYLKELKVVRNGRSQFSTEAMLDSHMMRARLSGRPLSYASVNKLVEASIHRVIGGVEKGSIKLQHPDTDTKHDIELDYIFRKHFLEEVGMRGPMILCQDEVSKRRRAYTALTLVGSDSLNEQMAELIDTHELLPDDNGASAARIELSFMLMLLLCANHSLAFHPSLAYSSLAFTFSCRPRQDGSKHR